MGRKLRARERRRYTEEFGDEEIEGARMFDVEEKLVSDKFVQMFVKEMKGEDLTLKYIQENGFDSPIVVKNKNGLGIKVPDTNFTVSDVKQCVGSRRILDVMDVTTQKDIEMTMKEWCQYYENTVRDRLLNVISLEFSHTKLDSMIESPTIVRQVDWVDWVWPKHLKLMQTESTNSIGDMKYPKVQKYCLMSVKGCYTDFHIDFGGTSVWYHILKGQKVFWLIPPSERNIQLFEQWVLSGKQSDIFFGDTVEQCARIELYDGYTFFIPTGWIHAVYTPEDSLVFGGNFLHSFAIEKQLRIAQVEDITKVPTKFRYPFYHEMLWYVLQRYVYCLTGKSHLTVNDEGTPLDGTYSLLETNSNTQFYSNNLFKSKNGQHNHLTSFELNGLKAIIMWLGRLTGNKRSVPDLIHNPEALLNDAKLLVDDHEKDDHRLAVTGQPVLFWSLKNKLPSQSSNIVNNQNINSNSNSSTCSAFTATTSVTLSSIPTTSSSSLPSSGLSVTAQLRQIKNTSFSSSFHLSSSKFSTSSISPSSTSQNDGVTKRPESPPTRPLSSNQYSINLTQLTKPLDQIPQSFAQLIATTGVGNQNRFNSPFSSMSPNPTKPLSLSSPTTISSSTQSVSTTTQTSDSPNLFKPNCDSSLSIESTEMPSSNEKDSKNNQAKSNPMSDSARRRRTRCKKCEACLRADCGDCHFCRDMKKFGGPGRMKQSCIARQCLAPVLPHTACCIICGRDGWEKMMPPSIDSEAQSSLLECSKCWEIVHPTCLKDKNPGLNSDGVMSDELPNSWECPKCIASMKYMTNALKFNTNKVIKPSSFIMSIEKPFIQQNSLPTKTQPTLANQDIYDFHTGDVLPETCKKARFDEERRNHFEENNNNIKNSETTDEESDSPITNNNSTTNIGMFSKADKLISTSPSTSLPSHKPNDSHVRSCARLPPSQEALKIQKSEKKLAQSSIKSSSSKSSNDTPKTARTFKKNSESSRDRLFKSLKGLKKNSEMVRFSSSSSYHLSSLNKKLPFKSSSPSNGLTSNSSVSKSSSNAPSPVLSKPIINSSSSSSSSTASTSSTLTQVKPANNKNNDVVMKEEPKEESNYSKTDQYMFDDETDNEIDEKENSIAASEDTYIEDDSTNDPPKIVGGAKNEEDSLIKPKYVVRPAPLPEDVSDDDKTEEETDEDDTSEDESEKSKARKKLFKKFNKKIQGPLNVNREVILPVFRFLPRSDLLKCMLICKKWNTWSMDPVLWQYLDLTRQKITYHVLVGIIRRQPIHLNLSWTNISKRQLAWLMARLPLLQSLNLTGSSAATISALCSSNTPLLRKLDLSWVDSLNDTLIKDLLSAPSDSRPGILETKTRLRNLTDLSVSGSEISDVSIRLLCNHLPHVSRIDLSNCQKVTDMGIGFLGASKTTKLVALNLSSCSNISDTSLEALKRCSNLVHLDVRECNQVSSSSCHKFITTSSAKIKLIMKRPKLLLARNLTL